MAPDFGSGVAVDEVGNAYLGGSTNGSLAMPNAGFEDAFLTKYDNAGNQLWSRQFGTTSRDDGSGVAVDNDANVFVSGGTIGNLGATNRGFFDAFLSKYDRDGNFLWSRQFGSTFDDFSYDVAVNAMGSAYIGGLMSGNSALLIKYDGAGNLLWSRQQRSSTAFGVAVDAADHAYLAGETLVGPYPGNGDIFLTKYDGVGNEVWSRGVGTLSRDTGTGVAVDAAGNAYISGTTYGSLGAPNPDGDGQSTDAVLIKYDAAGNRLWSRQIGTTSFDGATDVAVDALGNAYLSGYTQGQLVDPYGVAAGSFLAKYDGEGNLLWTRQFGPLNYIGATSLALDPSGNTFIGGYAYGSVQGSNDVDYDAFLMKFVVPEPSTFVLAVFNVVCFSAWTHRYQHASVARDCNRRR